MATLFSIGLKALQAFLKYWAYSPRQTDRQTDGQTFAIATENKQNSKSQLHNHPFMWTSYACCKEGCIEPDWWVRHYCSICSFATEISKTQNLN